MVGATVLGIILLILQFERLTMKDWHTSEATVLSSRVDTKQIYNKSTNSHNTAYFPHIVGEFSVDGKNYKCNRYRISDTMPLSQAKTIVKKYPPGSKLPVFFDPSSPSDNIFLREVGHVKTAWPLIGGFFLLGVMLEVIIRIRSKENHPQP